MGDEFLVSDEPNRAKFIKEIQASHKPASKQSSPPIPVITAEEFYENVVGQDDNKWEILSGVKLMDSFDPQFIADFDEIWNATFHMMWRKMSNMGGYFYSSG